MELGANMVTGPRLRCRASISFAAKTLRLVSGAGLVGGGRPRERSVKQNNQIDRALLMSEFYLDDDKDEPSKVALAMRRYRRRQKKGERCFMLYTSTRFLDALVKEGFLPEPKRPEDIDERAINEAVYRLLNAWRSRPR